MRHSPKRPFRILFTHWLPLLLWMLEIFALSHHDKDETTLRTGFLKELLALFNIDGAGLMSGSQGFVLRKLAHVTVYAILCALALRVSRLYWQGRQRWLFPLIFCFIYAVTDEFHQTFVPGRYGTPVDVGIDMIGVALVLLTSWGLQKRKNISEG